MTSLREGDPAPDFRASLVGGDSIHLSAYRGEKHVVLSFYPQDFTFGCTRQMCTYRDRYEEFQTQGAIILGVSGDDGQSHSKFRLSYGLPFPLISDPDRSLARLYGLENSGGLAGRLGLRPRVTFVIDKEGIIRAIIRHNLNFAGHARDALAALRRLSAGQR